MAGGKRDEVLGILADEVARKLRERQAEEQLLDVRAMAEMLRVSRRSVWAWSSSGRLPAPLRIGHRAVRWRLSDIRDWLERGCPRRDERYRRQ